MTRLTVPMRLCVVLGLSVLFSSALAPLAGRPSISAHAAERAIETPSAEEFDEHLAEGKTLTGEELYDRFLKNRKRLRTMYQEGRILSSDPAGNPQQTNYWLQAKDYRDANDDPVEGVHGKTLLKLTGPREMRHTGYLYIHKEGPQDDQFMYSPNRGRTFRVILKDQTVAGTDLSFDDFLVNLDDVEDADYKRHRDQVVEGVSCYVVEAIMKPTATSKYSRSLSFLEKKHYVPLKTRYWDEVGVEVKELISEHGSIREFDGAWAPTKSVMTDLLEETRSVVRVDVLEPNPDLEDRDFSVSSLESHP